jgi:formylglycine-generating enzyme required for sulfatase activity
MIKFWLQVSRPFDAYDHTTYWGILMRVHFLSMCLFLGVAALQSCGRAGPSQTKDIGGSPADVSKAPYVVFLTPDDSKVHKAECPSTNIPVNPSCPGLKDLSQLSKADYESGLRRAILALRPGGAPTTPANPALVKTLEDKIARINAKLSAGGLSDAEKASLQSQLENHSRELEAAKAAFLTEDEQNRYDLIMQKLNPSDDVTFDQGEVNYNLAVAAFCQPGKLSDGPNSSKFAEICPGTFMMGSPDSESGRYSDEGPQHQVTISKAFELQTTEVTQSQWQAVMGSNPSKFKGPDLPVEMVSWDDAQAFITKLNAMGDGYRYRLPTEAEWEYAARAGTTGPYAGDLDAMAWYAPNSGGTTHPVGTKAPNAWGLFDMHGNVWEWVQDFAGKYSASAVTDPVGPSSGSGRVLRGGSWYHESQYCRSAFRIGGSPGFRGGILGLRLLRTSP